MDGGIVDDVDDCSTQKRERSGIRKGGKVGGL